MTYVNIALCFSLYRMAGISWSHRAESYARGSSISSIERWHLFCDLIMWLLKQLGKGCPNAEPEWCLKVSRVPELQEEEVGINTLVEEIPRALEAFIFGISARISSKIIHDSRGLYYRMCKILFLKYALQSRHSPIKGMVIEKIGYSWYFLKNCYLSWGLWKSSWIRAAT